jgi:hypothetical protein
MPEVDLSEFERYARKRGPACSVGVALKALSPAQRRKVIAALAEPRITAPEIVGWVAEKGHELTTYSVQRHRRGDCSCD